MVDQLPSTTDPVSGANETVLGFLQLVRSDLAEIKAMLTPPPAKTGSTPFPNNIANNPVLAVDATDWVDMYGLSANRVAVTDHASASYAFEIMIGQTPGPYDYVRLPVDTVAITPGQTVTFAVDVQTAAQDGVSVTLGVTWGSQPDLESGSGSGVGGQSVNATIPSNNVWTRVEMTVTAPSNLGDHFRAGIQINGEPDDVVRLTLADYLAT